MSLDEHELAAAAARLRAETTVPGLLGTTVRLYVELFDAVSCTLSRVIGDLLVDLISHQRDGKPERLGHGYLVSDYPVTREVIEERQARAVFAGDPEADPKEVGLLVELGFDSLMMVAIDGGNEAWGLVEVYRNQGRRFTGEELRRAQALAGEVGDVLTQLERRV
jgi:GAF domain-containing protein